MRYNGSWFGNYFGQWWQGRDETVVGGFSSAYLRALNAPLRRRVYRDLERKAPAVEQIEAVARKVAAIKPVTRRVARLVDGAKDRLQSAVERVAEAHARIEALRPAPMVPARKAKDANQLALVEAEIERIQALEYLISIEIQALIAIDQARIEDEMIAIAIAVSI